MKCVKTAKIIILLITGIILSAIIGTTAFASVTWLSSIPVKATGPDDESAPGRIAIDAKGNIYVTDRRNHKDRLIIFDRNGNYVRTLGGLKSPVSVAVDVNGYIYIGSADTGSVDVYNADFTFAFKLGAGNNEVKFPGSIAVSADGHVFVVDTQANAVKVYNADHTYAFAFGAAGRGDGKFNEPYGIAIDDLSGEIYITDRAIITVTDATYGAQTLASARVQVFDLNGVFKRGFGQYGSGTGQMKMPIGIAVDGGMLYITDTNLGALHVFTTAGVWVETVSVPVLKTPIGVAIGKDKRIFVASSNSGSIEVYGQTGYTLLSVSPKTLAFSALEGGDNPAAQTVTVSNTGSGTLDWTGRTATTDGGKWLAVTQSGSAAAGVPSSASVSVDSRTTRLPAGSYAGTVTITGASGAEEKVAVSLKVDVPPAILSVSPSTLTLKAQQNGPAPQPQSFMVKNIGGGNMTWSASPASPTMLKLDISSQFLTVSLATTTLNAGTYNNVVTVTAPGAQASPASVSVNVQIVQAGTVKVSSNLANAAFDITGQANYAGSGKTWNNDEVVPGDYTITFKHVSGYLKPVSQKFSIATGKTITLSGDYRKKPVPTHIIAGSADKSSEMKVAILPLDSSKMPRSFTPFTEAESVRIASGDLDATGFDKIVVTDHKRMVRVFSDQGGEALATYELPEGYKNADVVVGDLDNDGKADILLAADNQKGRIIKLLSYAANVLQEKSTLFTEDKDGVFSMALGDVNNDGLLEVILVDSNSMRAFAVQQQAMTQLWVKSGCDYGIAPQVAAGDLNNDGIYEIAVSYDHAKEAKGRNKTRENVSLISIFKGTGEDYSLTIEPFKDLGYARPATIAMGDIDGDGFDELIAGAGPDVHNEPLIRIFESDGSYAGTTLKPLNGKNGVNVGLGIFQ